MTDQEKAMQAEIARLTAENNAFKNPPKKERALSVKITEKGGLSCYGLGRFPVTLYKEQWVKLLSFAQEIREFIAEHEDEFSTKPVKNVTTKADAAKVVAIQSLGQQAQAEVEGDDAA